MSSTVFEIPSSPTEPRTLVEPWPAIGPRAAILIAAGWTLLLVAVNVLAHPTPLYFVETDLIGEYIPAARELLAGVLNPSHYAFKGPGYPAMLAAASFLGGGDMFLAARVLGALAAGVAALLAFALSRRVFGGAVATFVLLGLIVAPISTRYAVEAGTDMPALALMLAATWLVVARRDGMPTALAGLIAGIAILTRTNAAFLVPAALASFALRGEMRQRAPLYLISASLPLAAWAIIAARAGGLPADRNYLNVAWELYGQGVPWERFEVTTGARFHSMLDVLLHDPFLATGHIARNFFVQRLADLRALTTPWLGALAVPGLWLVMRERAARPWAIHAAACALVLAPVFYSARFALYLLPFELAAAGMAWAWVARRIVERKGTWRPGERLRRLAVPLAAGVTLSVAACLALAETRQRLSDAPHEVRVAGAAMARRDSPGAVVMARKPHVGYFAGMRTAALPLDVPLWRLGAWASEHGVDYLFYSGIERIQRPEYGVLADSAVALPGLEPQAWSGGANGYALYRFNDTPVDSLDFAVALRGALSNYEARHGEDPADLLFVAVQYLSLGDPAAARTRLDRLVRGGAADPGVERMRSLASEQLGDLAGAIDACQRAMALEPATGWHWARMGRLRAQVGDLPGARDAFERAVALEPANRDVLILLGRTQVAAGDPTSAAATFERALRLDPGDVEVRRFVAGAWQLAGNEARMRAVLAEGLRAGASRQELAGETRGEEGVTAP